MTPKDERAKERIGFLSRLLLAYVAGVYLLVGAAGNYLKEWLAGDELVWSEFGIIPTLTVVAAIAMALAAFRLRLIINRHIDQIGETS